MKNDIKPLWEDKLNIERGYISIKLNKDKSKEKWDALLDYFTSDNIYNNSESTDNINGISITPKKILILLKSGLIK